MRHIQSANKAGLLYHPSPVFKDVAGNFYFTDPQRVIFGTMCSFLIWSFFQPVARLSSYFPSSSLDERGSAGQAAPSLPAWFSMTAAPSFLRVVNSHGYPHACKSVV